MFLWDETWWNQTNFNISLSGFYSNLSFIPNKKTSEIVNSTIFSNMFGGFPPFFDGKTTIFPWQNPPLISPAPAVRLAAWPPWAARAKQWASVGFHPTNGGFHGISWSWRFPQHLMGIPISSGDVAKIGIEFLEFQWDWIGSFNGIFTIKIVGHPTFLLYPTKTLRLRFCLAEFRHMTIHIAAWKPQKRIRVNCKLLWGVFSFGLFWLGAAHIEGDVSRVSPAAVG